MGHLAMPNNVLGTCSRHFLVPCYLLQTDLDVLYRQNAYVSHNTQGIPISCQVPSTQMVADYRRVGEMDHGKRTLYKDPGDNYGVD